MMKTHYSILITLASASIALSGCANQPAAGPTPQVSDSNYKKTYTQEDLERSGRAETGPALEQIDPDVHSNRHP
jgi:uncharacterized lipoprotein YbaY